MQLTEWNDNANKDMRSSLASCMGFIFSLAILVMAFRACTYRKEIKSEDEAYRIWHIPTPIIEEVYAEEYDGEHGIDQAGLDLIKRYESYRACAYWDIRGYSIGYGSVAKNANECINQAEAERRLMISVDACNRHVDNLVTVPLNQGQFNAMVSLCYNIGVSRLKSSDLLAELNAGNYDIAGEFRRWKYCGKEVCGGLVKRREAEIKMWEQK